VSGSKPDTGKEVDATGEDVPAKEAEKVDKDANLGAAGVGAAIVGAETPSPKTPE